MENIIIDELNDEELFNFVEEDIADKITRNRKEVRYSYFELKVRKNIKKEETLDKFLKYSKIILEELGYNVFFTGAKFTFENANRIVESNEYMIAVKDNLK